MSVSILIVDIPDVTVGTSVDSIQSQTNIFNELFRRLLTVVVFCLNEIIIVGRIVLFSFSGFIGTTDRFVFANNLAQCD